MKLTDAMACALLFTLALPGAAGLYFELDEGEAQCFIERVPGGALLVGEVDVLNFAELVATGVIATAKRTDTGKALPLRCSPFGGAATASGSLGERGGTFVGRAGSFVGSAAESAEFTVCFAANTTSRWGAAQQKLKLRVRMQERADDAERHEAKVHFSHLHTRIRELVERVEMIGAAQQSAGDQETEFHETTVQTSRTVVYWSLTQTGLLIIAGAWQLSHLRGFFDRRVRI